MTTSGFFFDGEDAFVFSGAFAAGTEAFFCCLFALLTTLAACFDAVTLLFAIVFLDNNQTSNAHKKAEYNVDWSNMSEAGGAGNNKTAKVCFNCFDLTFHELVGKNYKSCVRNSFYHVEGDKFL
ncbi:MAG: hypothetical protein WCS52_15235 [bacterium]